MAIITVTDAIYRSFEMLMKQAGQKPEAIHDFNPTRTHRDEAQLK